MTTIGFIGLGHMGLPMAINLVKAGHMVIGYDLQDQAKQALQHAGGKIAVDLAQIASSAEIFITMLQTGEQVKKVCTEKNGLYAHAQKNSLHIDCSTIDVHTAQFLATSAREYQLRAIDAPVSGGVAGAQAATLTFMIGGAAEDCSRASPILAAMGKQLILAGKSGHGQAAKICNNMILGISMIAVAEGFVLGESLGLDPKKLHEVISHASGQCWVMDRYVPVPDVLENVPANRGYQPGFTMNMMLKDLNLSMAACEQHHLQLPIAERTTELFHQAKEKGLGDLDFSAIIKEIQ